MTTKLITPKALLSYPHLDKPQPAEDGKVPKYSGSLVFTPEVLALPDEKKLFDAMMAAAVEAINAKWPGKAADLMASESFKRGFRKDAKAKGYPDGSIYISVRSAQKPRCVYAYAGADGKPAAMPDDKILAEMYPGAIVRASVAAFAFENSGNKGVSFGLNNLQKLAEGTRLDGRAAAEDEFTVDLSAAPADIGSLL